MMDLDLPLAGVILNRVAPGRHEDVVRQSLAAHAGVPVLGAIPRLEGQPLPARHLGLLCASEHPEREAVLEALGEAAARYVDLDAVWACASRAPPLPLARGQDRPRDDGPEVRIGVLRDAAFSFYYPENLEALEEAGAELVPVSPLSDRRLPAIDALYAGGGFPEEHAEALAANESLRADLARALADGLPAWAECGGLMYLGRAVVRDGREFPMVGALPIVVEHTTRPQGHGYTAASVDRDNPFFPVGTRLVGHEFHHSRIVGPLGADTAMAVERGAGLWRGQGREGLTVGNVVATYLHVHALGTPGWASGLVRAARRHAARIAPRALAVGGVR
jgi:cobyrinic acid a,c-diamide synthase